MKFLNQIVLTIIRKQPYFNLGQVVQSLGFLT